MLTIKATNLKVSLIVSEKAPPEILSSTRFLSGAGLEKLLTIIWLRPLLVAF